MEERSSSKRSLLLRWIAGKIPQCNITNLTSDWRDGKAICHLVNSLRKDSIPDNLFKDTSNAERNASIGIQMAAELFKIPSIVSSADMCSEEIDEMSMMTYLSMFYDVENSANKEYVLPVGQSSGLSMKSKPAAQTGTNCKVYGEGLFSATLNQVAAFTLELNGANPADLVISVECQPFAGIHRGYRPDLSVRPIDSIKFEIKYSPKRCGIYTIAVLHHGVQLWGSPFTVSVGGTNGSYAKGLAQEKGPSENTASEDSGIESTPVKNSSSRTENRREYKAEGPGLRSGEVGNLGVFYVVTETNEKGPLSVCITCPAVSIPVPYVKSRKTEGGTVHTVKYTPTEPGNYEIHVKWGEMLIQGCPFHVEISEVNSEVRGQVNRDKADIGGRGKIRLYYSLTSLDEHEQARKDAMEGLLHEAGVTGKACYESPIAIDLLCDENQRNAIFKRAGSRNTPFVFVDDNFVGDYDQISILHNQGLLHSALSLENT